MRFIATPLKPYLIETRNFYYLRGFFNLFIPQKTPMPHFSKYCPCKFQRFLKNNHSFFRTHRRDIGTLGIIAFPLTNQKNMKAKVIWKSVYKWVLFCLEWNIKHFSMGVAEPLKVFTIKPFCPHLEKVILLFLLMYKLFSLLLLLNCKRWKLMDSWV